MAKKIGFIITIAVIGTAIWYLESMKVQPAGGGNAAPQAINVPASEKPSTLSVQDALRMIANSDKDAGYTPAIEIVGPTGFVNTTSSFKLANLIGKKVILVDFWTYSCINCIRTLPYLTSWYNKYKDQGFVIVGIHTPEFDFEKDINNVKLATMQYGIHYPVILDSDYGTWNAYGNRYWPHEYLIDLAGYIVHDHIGEGGYDETETIIKKLLEERATALGTTMKTATSNVAITPPNLSGIGSPETYFGAARNQFLANGAQGTLGDQTLSEPGSTSVNNLYLVGNWNFQNEYAVNRSAGAKIIYKYSSSKVFFVASAPNGATVQVFQDGKPVSAAAAGSDVHNGVITVKGSRLYNVIDDPGAPGEHTLELIIDSPGLEAFTFTFG